MANYRFIRIMEYEGTADWIMQQMSQRQLKGSMSFGKAGNCGIIREAIIGEASILLDTPEDLQQLIKDKEDG
tara:strand:- start:112 stop:327 length:216 start_codon:yes stop_codon:yes gene_type:complete